MNSTQWLNSDLRSRVAAAAYALAMSNIQGSGSNIDYNEASKYLLQSAELGFIRSQEQNYRLFGAVGIPFLESLQHELPEWIAESAIRGKPEAMGDPLKISQDVFDTTQLQIRSIYGGVGIDIFGDRIREAFKLNEPQDFISLISDCDIRIPDELFEDGDGEGLTWLHYAASNGSSEVVQLLLQEKETDVNCLTTSGGWSLLWMACAAGRFETAILLLENGADPKIPSQAGKSCLHRVLAFDIHRIATSWCGNR